MRRIPLKRRPLFSADAIPDDSREILEHFDRVAADVLHLSGKHRVQLGGTIKRLSHELTDRRSARRVGYMNDSGFVSAYINYFMWWNLVRLTRLFAPLPYEAFSLADGDVVLDMGSGPLTVPIALWLARPELRTKKLTVYCMDLSQTALASGEELYLSVAAKTLKAGGSPWNIVRVRGELGTHIKEKAALVTCVNVCNELLQSSTMPPDFLAKKYSGELLSYIDEEKNDAGILLVEPGDPVSARFVALMREALLRRSFVPLAPCPHAARCPMTGNAKKGGKWCNFAFAADDVPPALQKVSAKAGLPKERAVLSFVLAKKGALAHKPPVEPSGEQPKKRLALRITSDFIRLPELHKSGYYACSELGLVLAVDKTHVHPQNGELLSVAYPADTGARDKKSGAILLEI
ncbi:MAG: hypothetical protein HDR39_02690 [Treponema sp.]|nr:hypothetical protein [Treponema sp.]